MKIGILTLPLVDNYGGILQAVALYRLLEEEGNDVVLIYKETHQKITNKLLKELLLRIPFHNIKSIKTTNNKKAILERKNFHRSFIESEISNISKNLYTKKDLIKYADSQKFDAVIVGSDQVWRKSYINDKYYKSYFLDFVNTKHTKKIAYAASFGKDHWEGKNDSAEIAKLLNDFYSVSTRELSGISICRNTFNLHNVEHVLDPTLLMNKKFYLNEIISKYDILKPETNTLLTYVLDEAKEKKDIINLTKTSLNIDFIEHIKGFKKKSTKYSVPQWIASFAYSDYIVTDSFHGMLFSIIFEKNFIVIGNKNRGLERFTSILSLLEIEDRLVYTEKDINFDTIKKIDYTKVNKTLSKYKENSLNFIKNSLLSK